MIADSWNHWRTAVARPRSGPTGRLTVPVLVFRYCGASTTWTTVRFPWPVEPRARAAAPVTKPRTKVKAGEEVT
jgi:hypothetical protein